jgi:DnaK suppressor protein
VAKKSPAKGAARSAKSSKPAPKSKGSVKSVKSAKSPVARGPEPTKSSKPAKKDTKAGAVQSRSATKTAVAPAVVRPPVTPVGSSEAPRKNQAGLGKRDLEYFRDLLLEKRRELVGDMSSMEREALRSSGGTNLSNLPVHMADMGTDNYEQEFTLGLVEKDRVLLREINSALGRIQDGTYGICEGTGKPIGRPRLEAQPWARYSIEHTRQMEKGRLR